MATIVILKDSSTGEFRVPGPNGSESQSYYTDDKQDAINTAKHMYKDKNVSINFRSVSNFDKFQNTHFQNGRLKAQQAIQNKMMALNIQKYDPNFIRQIASMFGHNNVSDKDCKRAHDQAKRYNDAQDYLDALKKFFGN